MKMRICALSLLMILMMGAAASAADALHRFMHNDHDVLALGEITELDEKYCVITVSDTIVSAKGPGYKRKQLQPETMVFAAKDFLYRFADASPTLGDYVLVSAAKKRATRRSYRIAWGCYRVDRLEKTELSVVLPETAALGYRMEAAAIERFLSSGGADTEFFFNGIEGEVGLYLDGKYDPDNSVIIYPTPTPAEQPMPTIAPN